MAGYCEEVLPHVKFSENRKLSVLIDVASEVFCISFENKLSQEESFGLLREILNRHISDYPPNRIYILDLTEIKVACNYFIARLYSQYDIYTKCFAKKVVATLRA